jgi:hypothetical protein
MRLDAVRGTSVATTNAFDPHFGFRRLSWAAGSDVNCASTGFVARAPPPRTRSTRISGPRGRPRHHVRARNAPRRGSWHDPRDHERV